MAGVRRSDIPAVRCCGRELERKGRTVEADDPDNAKRATEGRIYVTATDAERTKISDVAEEGAAS